MHGDLKALQRANHSMQSSRGHQLFSPSFLVELVYYAAEKEVFGKCCLHLQPDFQELLTELSSACWASMLCGDACGGNSIMMQPTNMGFHA